MVFYSAADAFFRTENDGDDKSIIADGTLHTDYDIPIFTFRHHSEPQSYAQAGDVLILTKPLGVGIITTAAKADMVEVTLLDKIYQQMATLNKTAKDIMVKYDVHSCTDVTGFGLLGHCFEMAQGSNVTIHLLSHQNMMLKKVRSVYLAYSDHFPI